MDDKVVYELHVPSNVFRAEKLPPYYAGEVMEEGPGKMVGSMCPTEEFETEIPAENANAELPDHYEALIEEEEDRIRFNATFEKGEVAMLILEEESGIRHRYYINTSAAKRYEAMCVKVKVILEDKIYDTGVVVAMD